MKSIYVKIGVVLTSVFMMVHTASASPTPEEVFFEDLKSQTLSILNADNLSIADKRKRVKDMILEYTAVYQIGRSVLGPPWRKITKQQQQDYSDIFAEWVSTTLAKRLVAFNLQGDIKVIQKHTGNNGILVVSTQVDTKTQGKVTVDWYIRKIGDSPKLINVSIANVSMIATQRSEFSVVYGQRGLVGLMDVMAQQISENTR